MPLQRVLSGNHPVVATNHTLILNWWEKFLSPQPVHGAHN